MGSGDSDLDRLVVMAAAGRGGAAGLEASWEAIRRLLLRGGGEGRSSSDSEEA